MIDTSLYRPSEFQYSRPHQNRTYVDFDAHLRVPDSGRAPPDWAGEMERRASDRASLASSRARAAKNIQDVRAAAAREMSAYEDLKAKFTAKYGSLDSPADLFGSGDQLTLSDRAKEYLADMEAMENRRYRVERLTDVGDSYEASIKNFNDGYAAMIEHASAGWDMRYAATPEARYKAYERLNEMSNVGTIYGAQSQLANDKRRVRDAAVAAGAAALTAGLEGPALFKVSADGRIDFSTKGLEHLSPDAQLAAQLKRLVEIMSVRNGLSPLKGAVAQALQIQNDYIASHPVVAGVIELPH